MILALSAGALAGIIVAAVILLVLIIIIANLKVVRQTDKYIIERLGAYKSTLNVGIHLIVPFLDRVAYRVSMKEQVKDFEPQSVITKDNVTMQIDTVIFFQVTDPKLYAYGVDNPITAIEYLSATTIRNIIGELDLDATLTSRDIINEKMRKILDEATDPWGIKVNRVEVKNILPPKDIRDAMERQMRAEREKREKILLAEGQKQSAILVAEGEKASMLLNAEAQKEAKILAAEAEAESVRKVKEAEADGIRAIREAEKTGLKELKEAEADESVLKLRYYETLAKVADGKATKIFIPENLSGIASIAQVFSEVKKD